MTPRNQEKLFKREYAAELLRIADGDFESARILASAGTGRSENCAYHAQQSIEKAIKAVLCWMQIPVPLVHDAGILVAKLPNNLTPPGGYDLAQLTQFATIRRYEEASFDISAEELQQILTQSKLVLDWAKDLLK